MPATILSLGMIVKVENEKSINEFQRLADELELKDKNGQPLNVKTLLPQLYPWFMKYNLGLSTEDFIDEFHKILPIPKEKIKAAWEMMPSVDDQALETLTLLNALKKDKTEEFYIYSDTNPPLLKKILDAVLAKRPNIGQIKVFTTFENKVSKEDLFILVANQAKKEGHQERRVIIGTNAVKDQLLHEGVDKRDQGIMNNAKTLNVKVELINSPRLSAAILKDLTMPASKKEGSQPLEENASSSAAQLTYGFEVSKQKISPPTDQPERERVSSIQTIPAANKPS